MGIAYKCVLSSSGGGGGSIGVPIDSFAITTQPSKTTYAIGDDLDTTGMVITATADGMSGNVVNKCTFSPTKFNTLGAHTVTASYHTESTTFDILVTPGEIGTLEETSWSLIKQVAASGQGSQYWSVGDTKSIIVNGNVGTLALSNFSTKVYIIDFNYRNVNGIYFQCFKNAAGTKDISLYNYPGSGLKTDGTKYLQFYHWGKTLYGGWKGSDMRYDILGSTDVAPSGYGAQAVSGRTGYDASSTTATNPVPNTLMAALPSDLRAVIAPWTIYTNNLGYNSTAAAVTSSVDYLPLLAEFEILGERKNANTTEQSYQTQITYYANGGSKVKYRHSSEGSNNTWWTRSPSVAGTTSDGPWVYINTSGASAYATSIGTNNSVTPAFRVA